MERVLYFINLVNYSKDNFYLALNKVKGSKFILMGHSFLVIIRIIRKMEKVGFNGQMVKYMMVNGLTIENMEVDNGRLIQWFHMLDNGWTIKYKALVS